MGAKLRSRMQQIKQYRVPILVVAIILVVVITMIIIGYRFDWTGFNGNNKSGKTLWDWLQLIIIPAVLTLGAIWFTSRRNHDLQIAREQHEHDLKIAADNQREAALQGYLDKMSQLLLEKDLRKSQPGDEVRNIANVRTVTILPQLDSIRKRNVLRFLQEASLIYLDKTIVNLNYANLRGADLHGAALSNTDLSRIDLRDTDLSRATLDGANLGEGDLRGARLVKAKLIGANLSKALLWDVDLREANLKNANLIDADLKGANVTLEQLNEAKSLQGATMPDGSIHP